MKGAKRLSSKKEFEFDFDFKDFDFKNFQSRSKA